MSRDPRARGPQAAEGGRTKAWIAIALLALVVIALLLWPRKEKTKTAKAAPDETATAAAGENDPASIGRNLDSPQALAPPPGAAADGGLAREQPGVPLAGNPYSPDTLLLAELIDPRRPVWDEVPTDKFGTFLIHARPAEYMTRSPKPIVIELEVIDRNGKRQHVKRAEASIRTANPMKDPPVYTMAMAPGADGVYRASFDAESKPELRGHVNAQTEVMLDDGKVYFCDTGAVFTREPDGRITGNYADEMKDGSLYVSMDVAIDRAGFFQIRAQLAGPNGEPVAESKTTERLDPGTQRMALHFFGKALVDRKVDGPYKVKFLYLSQLLDDGYEAVGPVLDEPYTTRAYHAGDFSPLPYGAPGFPGEVVGPDHPSQRNKPPPVMARVEGPTTTGLPSALPAVSIQPTIVPQPEPDPAGAPSGPPAEPPPGRP